MYGNISQLESAKAIENFKQDCNCKTPQALVAINGTHIFIQTPENERKYYYFRKQRYCNNTQVVVQANLLFLDIATGFPGNMHDSRILRTCSLFRSAEQN